MTQGQALAREAAERAAEKAALPDASITRGLNASLGVTAGERLVFSEEGEPGQYLRLVASGEITDYLLEALEDYVKRQRKRLMKAGSDKEQMPN